MYEGGSDEGDYEDRELGSNQMPIDYDKSFDDSKAQRN